MAWFTRRREGHRLEVDHDGAVKPAYGYRVDFDGRSAVCRHVS